MKFIKNKLEVCRRDHRDCTPKIPPSPPKRLIKVSSGNEGEARLVLHNDLDHTDLQYATLSYCWGKDQPTKLRKSNESQFLEALPLNSLPLTVRHAVEIAGELSIPYLWIDALCIVQDDREDWEREAVKMGAIYSGSSLTIAASESPDSSDGCFPSTETLAQWKMTRPRHFYRVSSPQAGATNKLLQIDVRGRQENGSCAPLHSRGWTLQEMVLSHRTFQLLGNELHWHCRELRETEAGVLPSFSEEIYGCNTSLQLSRDTEAHGTWWKWVENYTGRVFTYASDRIPAMAGITSRYAELCHDEPILGLWKKTLHLDLNWMRGGDARSSELEFVSSNNIPSWSWISCPASVCYEFFRPGREPQVTSHVEVVDCDFSWMAQPLVSSIRSGELTIRCPTRYIHASLAPEAVSETSRYYNIEGDIKDTTENPLPWKCQAMFDRVDLPMGSDWFCALLCTYAVEPTLDSGDEILHKSVFLVLEQTAKGEKYKGIGIGVVFNEEGFFDTSTKEMVSIV